MPALELPAQMPAQPLTAFAAEGARNAREEEDEARPRFEDFVVQDTTPARSRPKRPTSSEDEAASLKTAASEPAKTTGTTTAKASPAEGNAPPAETGTGELPAAGPGGQDGHETSAAFPPPAFAPAGQGGAAASGDRKPLGSGQAARAALADDQSAALRPGLGARSDKAPAGNSAEATGLQIALTVQSALIDAGNRAQVSGPKDGTGAATAGGPSDAAGPAEGLDTAIAPPSPVIGAAPASDDPAAPAANAGTGSSTQIGIALAGAADTERPEAATPLSPPALSQPSGGNARTGQAETAGGQVRTVTSPISAASQGQLSSLGAAPDPAPQAGAAQGLAPAAGTPLPAQTPDTALPVEGGRLTADGQGQLDAVSHPAVSSRAGADVGHTLQAARHQASIPASQVAIQIARHVEAGIHRFNIQLEPAELGRVEIKLEVGHDGRVLATVSADRADTLDLLARDARSLERALQDAGLKASSDSLNFSLKGEGQGGGTFADGARPGRGGGFAQDGLAPADTPSEDARPSSTRMLDISV